MKTQKKNVLALLLLALIATACGGSKSNSSGSTSDGGATDSAPAATTADVSDITSGEINVGEEIMHGELITVMEDKNFADGVNEGLKIWFRDYTISSSYTSTTVNTSFCIQSVFGNIGDCDTNSSSYSNSYQQALFQMMIDSGDLYNVLSSSRDSVTYEDMNENSFGVDPGFNRSSRTNTRNKYDGYYELILGKFSNDVHITEGKLFDRRGKVYRIFFVEIFNGTQHANSYIVSPDLPALANPVAEFRGSDLRLTRAVKLIGEIEVAGLNFILHRKNDYTGQLEQAQTVNLSL